VQTFDNIILIGMPGAGKSSIGHALAKLRGMQFIDTDVLIRKQTGKTLAEILKDGGVTELWDAESNAIESLSCHHCIISTGGSAIYHKKAMEHLRQMGLVVMIDVPLPTLKKRLGDLSERGVALRDCLTSDLAAVYHERLPLYRHYAHVRFATHTMGVKRCAAVLSHTIDNKQKHGLARTRSSDKRRAL